MEPTARASAHSSGDPANGGGRRPVILTARERARAEVTSEITATARRHLEAGGAGGLSLRAIARDLGMVSSGIYRYFETRDDLLTRLIIEAYDDLGRAVEDADARVRPGDFAGRFTASCRAIRKWSLAHPHEYALIFGSPVPGYQAPGETVPAATRVPAVLTRILAGAVDADRLKLAGGTGSRMPARARAAIQPGVRFFPDGVPPELVQRGVMVWSGIFGVISFELFGHLDGTVETTDQDREAFFDECIKAWVGLLGLK